MISPKYQNIYESFITHYKNVHVNPWHEISERELDSIYNDLINRIDVIDDYTFNYLMNYVIKRLSGESDAHTQYDDWNFIPLLFRVFANAVYISWPEELRGNKVISLNDIPIESILDELDSVITYGTDGQKNHQFEKSLFNTKKLYGLPSLRKASSLTFAIQNLDNTIEKRTYNQKETYERPPFNGYWNKNATYSIKDDVLIYNHFTVQNQFKEQIEASISCLEKEDLSNISKIIIDIRGNTGGNSALNKPLMSFLEKHQDKNLIALTDYRVFSGGRYALIDLIKLGAVTIGTGIGTPLNCYGNSNWINVYGYAFSSSESYLSPSIERSVFAHTKEEFKSNIKDEDLMPNSFTPDIYVDGSFEDFLSHNDPIMNAALNYEPFNRLKQ